MLAAFSPWEASLPGLQAATLLLDSHMTEKEREGGRGFSAVLSCEGTDSVKSEPCPWNLIEPKLPPEDPDLFGSGFHL